MSVTISVSQLCSSSPATMIIDVRKEPARLSSMLTIPGAIHRAPFSAEVWWPECLGRHVVVFCVHGHEVSRAVCGFLRDGGVDAAYLDGGFEEWRAAGLPVEAIGPAR